MSLESFRKREPTPTVSNRSSDLWRGTAVKFFTVLFYVVIVSCASSSQAGSGEAPGVSVAAYEAFLTATTVEQREALLAQALRLLLQQTAGVADFMAIASSFKQLSVGVTTVGDLFAPLQIQPRIMNLSEFRDALAGTTSKAAANLSLVRGRGFAPLPSIDCEAVEAEYATLFGKDMSGLVTNLAINGFKGEGSPGVGGNYIPRSSGKLLLTTGQLRAYMRLCASIDIANDKYPYSDAMYPKGGNVTVDSAFYVQEESGECKKFYYDPNVPNLSLNASSQTSGSDAAEPSVTAGCGGT